MKTRGLVASTVGVALLLTVVLPLTAGAGEERAAVGSPPPFPAGASYDALIATLPGFGLLLDTNGNGKLNDEYCDTNGEANLALVAGPYAVIQAGELACHAIPEPGDDVCAAALVAVAVPFQANAIVITQCGLQDGFVDKAQVKASFENTRHAIASGLERNLLNCNLLVSLRLPQSVGGRAEEVRDLFAFRIGQFETVGQAPLRLSKAKKQLAEGDADFAAARYRKAYEHWCLGYQFLLGDGI
jgi:hypothetical protein